MINAVIVGLGRWGKNIVGAVQGRSDRLRFTGCVARRPETAREFAAQQGLEVHSGLAAALADSSVQAIVLTTPHSVHVEQVIAAAAAGKAVFCEKPLALTRQDAARAIEACRAAGVPLGLGHDKRFWPSMRELKRVVAGGELGTLLHIEGHFSNESTRKFYAGWREKPEESPGGGLTATGIHVIDAMVNLVGPARSVSAHMVSHPSAREPVDTLSVFLEFGNRVSGVLCGIRTTPQFWRVHVFGTDGSAEALEDTELVLRMTDARPRRLSFDKVDALRLELEAFADAVAGRAPYPVTTAQMMDDVSVLEATLRSIDSKGPVQL
jgi:predicted dehydrogenase